MRRFHIQRQSDGIVLAAAFKEAYRMADDDGKYCEGIFARIFYLQSKVVCYL